MSFSFLATGLLVFGALGVGLREIDHPGYPEPLRWCEAQMRGLKHKFTEQDTTKIKKLQSAFITADNAINNDKAKHKNLGPEERCTQKEVIRMRELETRMMKNYSVKHVKLGECYDVLDEIQARTITKVGEEAAASNQEVQVTLGAVVEQAQKALEQSKITQVQIEKQQGEALYLGNLYLANLYLGNSGIENGVQKGIQAKTQNSNIR